MSRDRRHARILTLLDAHRVESQEQLQRLLDDEGLGVNQATLSRDLRALGVVKQPLPDGGVRYAKVADESGREVALRNLRTFVHDVVPAGNLLVIRTRAGGAQPVALAIDGLRVGGVVGTVAGDDTVLAVVADGAVPRDVASSLESLIDKG